ncbi:uncharacterized protein [Montipora foliosa]|uniref:uncharacterized protein n=1 Tax=Montipora foliosa TaxID=591990 RepID=UPI0035F1737A
MAGSVALKLRTKLQAIFFTLGCFSQRFSWTVLAIGFFILIGFSVGLLTARIETDVEKLWVEVDGRLEKELQYTKDSLGEGSGTTNELLIHASNNGKGNILSVGSLQEHLRAVQKAIEVKVTIYNKTWSHSDLCYVPEVPSFNDPLVDGIVSSIIPCLIISPLDCFWDGAKVLKLRGVLPDIVRNFPLEWTKIQPSSLLSLLPLLQIEGEDEITELFFKAGITDGYQNRPCLDPTELDCPTTAPNSPSKSGQPPNVGIELTGGCKGFATELMEWAEELVVGGTKKATNGTLSSAKALQTILVLSGPQDLHKRWADKSQDLTVDWNIDSARKVLEAWQRSFTEEINKDVNNQDEFSIMAFDSASVTDLLQEFSQTSVTRIAIGYILMLIYAGLSLKRWCNAVHSHGSLGFAGVLLVTLSVAAGLGFCALVGISFNAASTQVLPFLALGLGVDDMFLLAHSYSSATYRRDLRNKEEVGVCVGTTGVSVFLTSFNNMLAFFMASLIPIPALRYFAIQAAVVVIFNFIGVIIIFPAMISLDIRRRKIERYDILCCLKRSKEVVRPVQVLSADDLSTPNRQSSASSKTELSSNQVTVTPTQTIVMSVLANDKSESSVADVLVNEYLSNDEKQSKGTYSSQSSVAGNHVDVNTMQITALPKNSTNPKGNSQVNDISCSRLSLEYFAATYYGPALQQTPVKLVVLVLFSGLLAAGIYGAFQVEDGLELTEVVPQGSIAHQFVEAQFKYFSFYPMALVTEDDFDYPNQQSKLYSYHNAFKEIPNVIRIPDSVEIPKFWMMFFREWLEDIQSAFNQDWANNGITYSGWYENASDNGIIGFKLLSQAGNGGTIDKSKVRNFTLVSDDGIIRPELFYKALTVWIDRDVLGYAFSQAEIRPETQYMDEHQNSTRPCSDARNRLDKGLELQTDIKTGRVLTNGTRLPDYSSKLAFKIGTVGRGVVVGGTKKATNGTLSSAKALQTILVLSGPQDLHKRWADKSQDLTVDWNIDSARKVLEAWQRSFTEEINKDVNNQDEFSIMAFDSASVTDLLQEFSQTSVTRIAIGYILMLIYAGLSLKRWCNAVHSHGSLGFAGVLLVTLSVAAGLGFCALVGISFNAASTQVLPFLALGLGVDDMFLLAHSYSSATYRRDLRNKEEVGVCVGTTGVSVFLTSFNNMLAFFMASLIPIPALRYFAIQAAVVVIFNFIGVIIIFPAMISLDIRRRKIERYDILCCLKRSKEVVRPVQVLSADDLSTPNRQSSASSKTELSSNQVTVTPTQTIVMSVLANDKSESSVADVLVNEYLSNDEKQSKGTYSSQSSVAGNHVDVNTMQITALPKNSTNPKGNSQVNDISCSRLSLEYFAATYYGPALQQTPVKLVVLVLFSGLLAAGIYGAFQVEDGLELTEVVPQGSIAHQFVEAQFKYFSFYPMALVTEDDFDYPNQQSKLYSYHNAFKEIPNVIRIPDSVEIPKFWMMFFREWLEDIQSAFNQDWANNGITYSGWYENASDNGIIGFKLLSQAGNGGTIDKSKVRNFTLVSDDGIIRPELFYKALTVWIDRDVLGYAFSQAEIRPETQDWTNIRTPQDNAAMQVPTAKPITFAKMNLNVIGLRETKDFVSLIKNVRAICDKFSADGLPNYPSGVPFTFWEQYIGLREQILLAIGISLGVSFVVVSAMLFNIWAAAVIVFTLTMITVELYGFMGLVGIQLSAVPAVTLILSVGVGVEFTVHMCMAFLYTPGNRNERMLSSVKHVFAPIVDGAISTFLGVVMLAGSPFQFIVRYFFNLLVALILIGSFNGLLFLPVLLSIAGPGAVAQEINTTGASHSLKFENQGAVGSSAESAISTLGAEETEMSAMKPAYNKRGTGHGSTLERTVQTTRHRAQVDPNGSGTNDACHGTCEQSSATAFDAKL